MIPSFSPARLNAFEADVSAAPRCDTVRYGVNSIPSKTSGAWISSESTHASCASAAAATASSSARVQTRPVGLCGLEST